MSLWSKKKYRLSKTAEASYSFDIIVSDDGLQHYALARDLEIAVLDAQRGVGNVVHDGVMEVQKFAIENRGVGDVNFRKKSEKIFREQFIKGKTVVFVTHKFNILEKHADRVLCLEKGKMIALGEAKEVISLYKKNSINEKKN